MTKKPPIDKEDESIFRDAMRGVKRLKMPKKVDLTPPPPQRRPRRKVIADDVPLAPLSDFETQEPLTSESLVEFKRDGIQHKILRKMRGGQYNVEAILDLHGMTVADAKETLYQFILHCQKKGATHLLLIHGKGRISGKPILKNKLNHWLRQLEQVLAFCSATTRDGQSGAMYVLIKRETSLD